MKTIYNKLFFLMFLLPFTMLAQSTLDGTVVDQKTKQPIPGVNVVVQGSPGGTQTDFDGKFKLSNVKKGDNVVFSYIGYKNQSITYNGQNNLTIYLNEDSNELKEVVVQTGYGSVKKKDATGSVALITSKDFNKGAIISTDQLLAGKAAGVRITNNGGDPDSAPNIRIRGGASLSASNNPLIIIDGVPLSDNNPAGVNNPLSLINPNDVESFSILKDASATAIYGVRASNGVILITTKKGTTGKPQFNFSTNVSIGKVGKQIDVMDGLEYTRFIQQYHPSRVDDLGINDPNVIDNPSTAINESIDNPLTPEVEGRLLSNTNWQDQIYRTAISSDHNFSARANLYGKIPFRASIGYNNSEGLVRKNDYERLSYSLKMTPKFLNDNLKVDLNAKGTYSDKKTIDEGGSVGAATSMDPTKPVYDNNPNNIFGGYYQLINPATNAFNGASNPLAILEQRFRPERALRFLGNVEFDYKMPFLKDLRAVVNLGLDASQSRIRETQASNAVASYTLNPTNQNQFFFNSGESFQENQTTTNRTMDAYLVYSKKLSGFVTKFDAQGGYAYQNFVTDGYKVEYVNNPTTGIREPKLNNANPNFRYYNPLNLQAFFGRTNFDLVNRYLFTLTFRADGTSLFKEGDTRWGYFPAAGFAWKVKEESFLKNVDFVQELKLRAGWGKTGQQNITEKAGYFPYRPFIAAGNNNSQYLEGTNSYSAQKFNEFITWEKTTTVNFGVDFEFFKRSFLSGSFDVYDRKTNDLLAVTTVLPGQGFGDQNIGNVGSTKSKGFELNLNLKPVQSDNINFSLNGNVGYNKSEVSNLNGITSVIATESGLPTGTGVLLADHAVGYEPYSAFVFEQLYDVNGNPITGQNGFKDRNGDNEINNKDKYYKALRPNWTYGFGASFNYNNLDFTANFRGQIGGQVYNARLLTTGFTDRATQGTTAALNNVLDFYNGAANPAYVNFNGFQTFSDKFLEDASFLRCDNITLGYKINKFVKDSSIRFYASVNNAFIVTKYSGQDPENFNAIDNNFYPRPRVLTFGLNFDF
jgi:TonB-dependent starch-binding outer membrane protein SusC